MPTTTIPSRTDRKVLDVDHLNGSVVVQIRTPGRNTEDIRLAPEVIDDLTAALHGRAADACGWQRRENLIDTFLAPLTGNADTAIAGNADTVAVWLRFRLRALIDAGVLDVDCLALHLDRDTTQTGAKEQPNAAESRPQECTHPGCACHRYR